MNFKIDGVVVLYNPKIEVIKNIETYIIKMNRMYIIDNSEVLNQSIIQKIINKYSNKVEYVALGKNEGIAKALNIGIEKFLNSDSEMILTMDQDSYFSKNNLDILIQNINKEKEKIGIFSPIHKITTGNFIVKKDELKEKVMTSGNILTKDLINEIGKFNEDLFIDEVDYEYCFRAREKGYKIKVYGNTYLNHNLGEINKKSKLPQILIPTNHNSVRRYYMTRNKLFMMNKYPVLKYKYLLSICNDFLKILLFEKEKMDKINMMKKGYLDYKKGKFGKYN